MATQGSLGTLSVDIRANMDGFNRNMEQVQSRMTNVSKKLKSIGKTMTAGLTLPIMGFGAFAIKTTADFDKSMSEVQAISGATGNDLDTLRQKAKDMGSTTKFSASESAEAMKFMAMAGWDATKIIGGLDGVMNLAAASGEELALVSDIVTDAMTAFKLEAEDAGKFADILAAASSKSNTNVAMLGESFKYVAPLAGAVGYEVGDTAIALGLMANAGIKAGQSGTALRAIITRMTKPTKESSETIEKLGLSIANADGTMRPLSQVMDQLREKFSKLTPEQQAVNAANLGGQEAMSGLLAIVNASQSDYDKLSTSINNATGTAKEMAKVMGDNLTGQLTRLKSALEGIMIQIGEILIPILGNLITKYIEPLINWFAGLSTETKTTTIIIGGLVAIFGPLLLTIGFLIPAITTLVSVIGGITLPITAVVIAVSSLIAIFTHLWRTNEDFRNAVVRIWNEIKRVAIDIFVNTLMPALKEVFENISETAQFIFTKLMEFWDKWGADILIIMKAVWEQIKTTIETTINIIKNIIVAVLSFIRGDWDAFGNAIMGIVDTLNNYIIDTLNNFAPVFGRIWEGMASVVKSIWENIKTSVSSAISWIVDKIEAVMKRIEGVKNAAKNIGSGIKSVGNKIVGGAKSIVGFETGTNYVPNDGLAYLHKGEAVVPQKYNNPRGMGSITVNVTGNSISGQREADKMASTIVSRLRMAGVTP